MGYLTTGSNLNLLTVVAMLGMLPASKSAVDMILFFKTHGCPEETYQKIEPHAKGLPTAYELYLTSYSKNFPLDAVTVKNNTIVGLTLDGKCDCAAANVHILEIMKKNALKPSVKIFTDISKYCRRLDELKSCETEKKERDLEILELLKAVSI